MEAKQPRSNQSLFRTKISGAIVLIVALIAAAIGGSVGKSVVASYFMPAPASQTAPEPTQPEVAPEPTQPEWDAIQKYYPTQYSQIMNTAPHTLDPIAMHNTVEPIIIKILADHQSQISDDNLEKSYSVFVSEAKVLRAKDPAACISLISGTSMPVYLNSIYPPDIIQNDIQTTTSDLIQIATQPAEAATPLSEDQFKTLVVNAFNALPPDEQAQAEPLIDKGGSPTTIKEDQSMCDLEINLFLNALSGPPGTLKSLLARNR
jgi:hypothetical protein